MASRCTHRYIDLFLWDQWGVKMKRHNKFYPPIDPPEDPDWKKEITVEKYCTVCIVCGCRGTKKCGGCKKYIYCTRDHQLLHWKNGHKQLCKQGNH